MCGFQILESQLWRHVMHACRGNCITTKQLMSAENKRFIMYAHKQHAENVNARVNISATVVIGVKRMRRNVTQIKYNARIKLM